MMGVSSEDLKLARSGYALWNSGDIDGMVEHCLSEDIEFYPDPSGPWQQVYRGAEEVKGFLRDEVAKTIGLSEIVIDDETIVGDEVVFLLRLKITGDQSGLELGDSVYHVTRIQHGRVNRIRGFLNKDDAMRSVGVD